MSDEMLIEDDNIETRVEYPYPTVKPENPKNKDMYIDLSTNILWKYYNRKWVDKGSYLEQPDETKIKRRRTKAEMEAEREKLKTKAAKIRKRRSKAEIEADNKGIDVLLAPSAVSDEDEDVRQAIRDMEQKELISKLKETISPDSSLVVGNHFYFVVDVTPSSSGNKISFEFVDYLSRYFVGATIYLIGIDKEYTLDHFRKKRANVIRLTPSSKKILNSYIAYSRRFYTFSREYAKWAVEHNINGVTLFVPTGSDISIPNVDICEINGNVDLKIISTNKGNVLTY